jgi:hypothetical protein
MTNVLIDEANRKHAQHAARAAAVAGAKNFEEARTLGAAHVQKEAAERTNAAAYAKGVASAGKPRFEGFTTEKVNGRWWLCTPAGNGFFFQVVGDWTYPGGVQWHVYRNVLYLRSV